MKHQAAFVVTSVEEAELPLVASLSADFLYCWFLCTLYKVDYCKKVKDKSPYFPISLTVW